MVDPLSDILTLLRPRRQAAGIVNFGGDWEIRFPRDHGIRCYAIGRGEAWIEVEGAGAAVHLVRDDCVVLASGNAFRMGSASKTEFILPSDPTLFSRDGISTLNGGGACVLIGGHFLLDTTQEDLLSSALPPLIVVRDPGQRDALGSALKGLWFELEEPQPGGRLVIEHLNHMMLIFALRLCVSSDAYRPTGWLSALADKRIARALASIHTAPEKPWALRTLAAEASMSRTVFAECFKTMVGSAPMTYLHQWRMATASHHLGRLGMPVAQVAVAVGYSSATSFSTAFRKAFGVAPRDYVLTPLKARPGVELTRGSSFARAQSRPDASCLPTSTPKVVN